jgi:hypothetical protein
MCCGDWPAWGRRKRRCWWQFAAEGVAIGSTTLFDDDGPVGIASVTALANPAAKINFTGTARNDAPGAELYTGER